MEAIGIDREADTLEGLQKDEDDLEDFDGNKFLEEVMKQNMQFVAQSQADEKTQAMQELLKEMEMQQKKDKEEAQYSDNNFWRIKSADQTDKEIDDLIRELEEDSETTPAQGTQKTEETKEDDKEASKESESSEN